MAPTVHSTVLIDADLTGILPTNAYKIAQGGYEKKYEPAMTVERSLTGAMHIHRLTSAGDPVVFDGYQYVVILTRAEKDQLALDIGRVVYFMPHYRDDADVDYRAIMLFKGMTNVENLDPMLQYWKATILLEIATGNVV